MATYREFIGMRKTAKGKVQKVVSDVLPNNPSALGRSIDMSTFYKAIEGMPASQRIPFFRSLPPDLQRAVRKFYSVGGDVSRIPESELKVFEQRLTGDLNTRKLFADLETSPNALRKGRAALVDPPDYLKGTGGGYQVDPIVLEELYNHLPHKQYSGHGDSLPINARPGLTSDMLPIFGANDDPVVSTIRLGAKYPAPYYLRHPGKFWAGVGAGVGLTAGTAAALPYAYKKWLGRDKGNGNGAADNSSQNAVKVPFSNAADE